MIHLLVGVAPSSCSTPLSSLFGSIDAYTRLKETTRQMDIDENDNNTNDDNNKDHTNGVHGFHLDPSTLLALVARAKEYGRNYHSELERQSRAYLNSARMQT